MAFQFINYAGIPAQGNPALRNLAQSLMQGYQAARLPEQIQQEEQGRALANKLKELQAQFMPKQQQQQSAINQARLGLLQSQSERARQQAQAPFGGKIAPGAVGQAMWLDRLKQTYGEDSPVYKQASEALQYERQRGQSIIDRNQALSNSLQFRLMPADEKRRVLATAVGMGLDPTEATQLLSSGTTLDDIAKKQGVDLGDVTPIYPLQGEEIKQTRNRRAFSQEIKSLEDKLSEGMGEYGRKLFGYSPKQVVDAIKNQDPDKQGRFLAARALQPELSSLRLKAAGGNVGIEAIREMQQASLANSKVLESMVSPEARQAMNRYISDWIEEAVNTYTNSIERAASLRPERQEREQSKYRDSVERKIGGKTYVFEGGEWYEK